MRKTAGICSSAQAVWVSWVRRQNWMHFTFINCTSTTPCICLKPQHSSTAAQLHCTLHSYSTTWHGASLGTAPPILQDQVLRHLQDQEQQLPDHIPTLFKDQDRDRFLQELLQWLQHNPRHQISNYSKIKNSFLNMLNLGKIFSTRTTTYLRLFNNSALELITQYYSDTLVHLFLSPCHALDVINPLPNFPPTPPPLSTFGTRNMVAAWPWAILWSIPAAPLGLAYSHRKVILTFVLIHNESDNWILSILGLNSPFGTLVPLAPTFSLQY